MVLNYKFKKISLSNLKFNIERKSHVRRKMKYIYLQAINIKGMITLYGYLPIYRSMLESQYKLEIICLLAYLIKCFSFYIAVKNIKYYFNN